jgi:hypothetical protein
VKRDYCRAIATFLQRLLVGWTRSRGVKLVPFTEKEPTNVCSKTTDVILDVGARSRLFLSDRLDTRGVRLMTTRGGLTRNRGGLDASRPFGHGKKQSEHRGEGSCHPNHV